MGTIDQAVGAWVAAQMQQPTVALSEVGEEADHTVIGARLSFIFALVQVNRHYSPALLEHEVLRLKAEFETMLEREAWKRAAQIQREIDRACALAVV